ncbi:unnamed protein product, partial [Polarella glacialis]
VLRCFSGVLLSESAAAAAGSSEAKAVARRRGVGDEQLQVLWSPRKPSVRDETSPRDQELDGTEQHLQDSRVAASRSQPLRQDFRFCAQLSCLKRSKLEELLLAGARRDEQLRDAVSETYEADRAASSS